MQNLLDASGTEPWLVAVMPNSLAAYLTTTLRWSPNGRSLISTLECVPITTGSTIFLKFKLTVGENCCGGDLLCGELGSEFFVEGGVLGGGVFTLPPLFRLDNAVRLLRFWSTGFSFWSSTSSSGFSKGKPESSSNFEKMVLILVLVLADAST